MKPAAKSLNPWPIAIIGFFIVFGTFIAGFTTWAMHQREDLVAVNYYENEVLYQRQMERMKNTAALPAGTTVTFDAQARHIIITLSATQPQPATGRVHLYRPSDARLDRDLPLALDAGGVQRLDARELRTGLWKVRVEWSAGGKDFFLDQSLVVRPGRG